jgi:hypothetical protein
MTATTTTRPAVRADADGSEGGYARLSARRADAVVATVLVALPVLWFGIPALAGKPLMPGDDVYQNYPLRVLSGHLLAGGHLPLWDAWLWSGTPLLAGFNAGALYPGTFVFALVPPIAAWVANEIFLFAVCGLGLYALLRVHRLAPLAAAVGAVAFTFAGFMPSHLRHIGLIQGMSWAPWMLLAMEMLATRARHRIAWWMLLTLCGALVALSGEPRAIANVAVVVGVYALAIIWRARYWRALLTALVLAVPFVLALGAVQLLPGFAFLRTSQRAHVGYAWFAHGSLPPSQLVLSVVPYLVGGYSQLHLLPGFAGHGYTLPEVSGYVGLLALVALFTFPFWRNSRYTRQWAWVALIVVGLVLALGGTTPAGHVLARIPVYGHQRLQNRNLGVVDLGLAGLLACWVDAVMRATRPATTRSRRWLAERLCALLPVALVVALVTTAWLAPGSLQNFLTVVPARTDLFGPLRWYLVAALGVAVAVGWFVVRYPRLTPRTRAVLLVGIVAVDLGLALLNQELWPVDTATLRKHQTVTAAIADALRSGGRYALYDPQQRVRGDRNALANALMPDLNILYELPSIQGYSSVVDSVYEAQTATHTRRVVTLSALSGTTADDLDLTLLLVPVSYVDAAPNGAPGGNAAPVDPALQAALASPHWERAGNFGAYAAFTNMRAHGRPWLLATGKGAGATSDAASLPGGLGQVRVQQVGVQDEETDVVHTTVPARLVRSVAFGDGWRAELRAGDGSVRSVQVRRFGLVQAVDVPAGDTVVHWTYHPPGLTAGLAATLAASVVLGVGAVALALRHLVRRRRANGSASRA